MLNRQSFAVHTIMKTIKHIFAFSAFLVLSVFVASAQTSLPSLSGGSVDVQAQRGKVVILAVGASWLPLSGKQAEYTNSLAKKYAGKNVAIYFVLTDSTNPKSKNYATDDKLRQWASAKGLSVPILRDSEGAATLGKFGIDQLPSFVVLDKSGSKSGETFGGSSVGFDITVPISKKVDSLL
jgi:hypothetical protein